MFAVNVLRSKLETHFEERKKRDPAVYRAWKRLLIVVDMIAMTDFRPKKLDAASLLAAQADAWQEIEAGAKGFGEALPIGAIQDIYLACPNDDYTEVLQVFEAAFAAAWRATPRSYKSLYGPEIRKFDLCRLGEERDMLLPSRGARLRALVYQTDDTFAESFLSQIDEHFLSGSPNAFVHGRTAESEAVPSSDEDKSGKPRLRLLVGGKT